MQQASFSVNNAFLWNGKKFHIRTITHNPNVADDEDVLLESEPFNFTHTKMSVLLDSFCDSSLRFNTKELPTAIDKLGNQVIQSRRQLSDFSKITQQYSLRANEYLNELLKDGPIRIDRAGIIEERIAAIAVKLNDSKPPNKTTIFRWYKKYQNSGGDRHANIYRFEDRGGKNLCRSTEEETELQDKLIDELYLKKRGVTVDDLSKQMDLICRRENEWRIDENKLRSRSISSFRRRINQLNPFDVVAAREGVDEANRRFQSNGQVPITKRPLAIVEIDHTPFDLFVIDRARGVPLGRPTLTMAICRATKMPWGVHIGFDDCSTEAVLGCIENGIKPKTYLKKLFPEIKGTWPVYGIPEELRCDNGLEFHAAALQTVAKDFSFELAFCPKKQPNWKGSIESFLKTFNYQFIHKLPGTSLAKYYHRKDYDPLKAAVIDLSELNRLVHLWLVDIYMTTFHRSLGCTPNEAWKRGQMSVGYLPFSPEEIEIICNETEKRHIWPYGVELNGRQKYNSPALEDLKLRIGVLENNRSKSEVTIKVPKFDIGRIWVFNQFEKIWIKVPNVNLAYADGLTLYQHKIIQKLAKEMYKESDDYQVLIEAKEKMRQFVAELSNSKSLTSRKKAAKIIGSTSREAVKKNAGQQPIEVATEIDRKNSRESKIDQFLDEFHTPDEIAADLEEEYECEINTIFRKKSK